MHGQHRKRNAYFDTEALALAREAAILVGTDHPKYAQIFGEYTELEKEIEESMKEFDTLPNLKAAIFDPNADYELANIGSWPGKSDLRQDEFVAVVGNTVSTPAAASPSVKLEPFSSSGGKRPLSPADEDTRSVRQRPNKKPPGNYTEEDWAALEALQSSDEEDEN